MRLIPICCSVPLLFLLSSLTFGAEPSPLKNSKSLSADSNQAQATDTVRLKNGSILHGIVVQFENGLFTVVIPGTQSRATVHVNDVQRIEFVGAESTTSGQMTPSKQQPTQATVQRDESKAAPSSPTKQDAIQAQRSEAASSPTRVAEKQRSTPVTDASKPQETKPTSTAEKSAAGLVTQKKTDTRVPTAKEITVSVSGREVWADSGLEVSPGDRLRFSATGRVNLSRTQSTGPEGISISDPQKMVPTRPTGGLIAVIGDDNDDFIFIGAAAEFVAQRSGRLFLMVNENNMDDNSGAFTVRIQAQRQSQP